MLQPGDPERIGPYLLQQRLGSGGMGRVYLGHSPGGRRVAVKVIHEHFAEDDSFRARFRREVTAARRVGGAYTAPVVGAELDGPMPWIASVYVPGPSLGSLVSQRGPLPVPLVAALAAGLAEGLSAIHEAGVIHRDLTPGNVLLAEDGPRIIDFGIAAAAGATELTGTGLAMGTPAFMSPEQAVVGEVSPATDIFSLGSVLTYAARGMGPFGAGQPVSLLYRIVHDEPNLDRVPDALRPLIMRCLIREPASRPTAREFLAQVVAMFPAASAPTEWFSAGIDGIPHENRRDTAINGCKSTLPSPAPPGDETTQPRHRAPRRGRRWLWWPSGTAAAAVAGIMAFITIHGNQAPGASQSGQLSFSQYRAGDCLSGDNVPQLQQGAEWPASVQEVPCGHPHTAEVFYANFSYWAASSQYPGDKTVRSVAFSTCDKNFASYDGIAHNSSVYSYVSIAAYPASAWRDGARDIVCVAYYPTPGHAGGAQMSASIRGSRR